MILIWSFRIPVISSLPLMFIMLLPLRQLFINGRLLNHSVVCNSNTVFIDLTKQTECIFISLRKQSFTEPNQNVGERLSAVLL
jgi:hypothetical protein